MKAVPGARRILYVCHNHPMNRPGGAEIYAVELYEAIRRAGRFEPMLLVKAGPPVSMLRSKHEGTRFAVLEEDPNIHLFYTQPDEMDLFVGTATDKRLYTRDWREFLEATQPDVVHFQHTVHLGYDMVRQAANVLPSAPIIYTLHDFLPICRHSGQMVRTGSFEPCDHASPQRCHRCFPNISADEFFLRERYVKSAFAPVDLFIAPSRQLAERYVDWGLPEDRILVEEYGRTPMSVPPDPPHAGRRGRIGFFGQITPFKGVDVLLEAMHVLNDEQCDARLWIFGANLESQARPFQERIDALLDGLEESVTFFGPYARDRLPELMSDMDWVIVPSVWWENSPLVIQEALMSRRPVIASNIGGMAEKVRDGVDGLHFAVGDPRSLAGTIKRAISSPDLWDTLHTSMGKAHAMDGHVATLTGVYEQLLGRVAA
jgi:glycosyltransferase involved in cell wall biosynthesis